MRTGLALLVAVAMVAPASAASAQVPPGIGIRLVDAPIARQDDPRAHSAVVDHLQPGDAIQRRVEVSNGTDEQVRLDLYSIPARIRDGQFVPMQSGEQSHLTTWTAVQPGSIDLAPQTKQMATMTIVVPEGAQHGEHYGMVVAELPARDGEGVRTALRVGVRIYLSVGDGAEPLSDFVVDTLTAERSDDGVPVVTAAVENVGNRALDLRGELLLSEGPGGAAAGPFPAAVATTLAPADSGGVRIELDPSLPDGPWQGRLTLRSGEVERVVEAELIFPSGAGQRAGAVSATPVEQQRRVLVPIAASLLFAVCLSLGLLALSGVLRSRTRSGNRESVPAGRGATEFVSVDRGT